MPHQEPQKEQEFSFKSLFVPLTTVKAIHWIVIIGFVVYANMLFNGFVWDDKTFIINNPEIRSINPLLLFGESRFNDSVYYRPIPAMYFTTLYSLFSTTAFFYHLAQLSLHITNAIFLFFLFKNFLNKYISLFLSLIFLVHPMQVESVSYIAQTVSPLFFFFGMISLLVIMKKQLKYSVIIASIFLLLSLLTKETGIIFLILINGYNYFYSSVSKIRLFISSIGVLLIYLFIRFSIGSTASVEWMPIELLQSQSIAQSSFIVRLQTIPEIIYHYLITFIAPVSLGINQRWVVAILNLENFYFPLLVSFGFMMLLVVFGIYLAKCKENNFKHYVFFTTWFLFSLLIHLQLVPLNMTVADRWFYVMIVGLLGILGVITQEILKSRTSLRKIFFVVTILVIIALSTRTIVRNINWQNPITLYTHDIKINDNADTRYLLGTEYLESSQYDEAYIHLNKSTTYWPGGDQNWNTLGVYYQRTGQTDNAAQAYLKAIQNNNNFYYAYLNLASLYIDKSKFKEANNFLAKEALVKYPQDSDLWLLKGITDYRLGNKQTGISEVQKSYEINKDVNTLNLLKQMQNNEDVIY